jgi:type II secretory pathway component PulK
MAGGMEKNEVSVAPGRGARYRGRGAAVTIILMVTLLVGSVTAPLAHVIRAESPKEKAENLTQQDEN